MRIRRGTPATTRRVEARVEAPRARRLEGGAARRHLDLPASLTAALAEAGLLKKSRGPEGAERMLGPHARDRLQALLLQAGPPTAQALAVLLDQHAKSPTHRAVILRAVHARLGAEGATALAEIERFAARISTMSPEEVRRRATVLDLDSSVNASRLDPMGFAERRGVTRRRELDDPHGDNDGLYQIFSASCGPTTIQILAGEADPILAFAFHDAGLLEPSTHGGVAKFQAELLERYGGVALGQRPATLRARFRNALARAENAGDVSAAEVKALVRFVERKGRLGSGVAAALERLRARPGGFLDAEELTLLRSAKLPTRDRGIDAEAFQDALDRWLTPRTGVEYRMTNAPYGFARGQAYRHLDAVARTLARGVDVPFGISEPGHWMLLSAVRGRKPARDFLVSDPLGGRTRWVKEEDLLSGAFCKEPFQLSTGRQRGYVDCFFLPV